MIIIHCKVNCPFCDKAINFLSFHKLPYQKISYDPSSVDYQQRKNSLINVTHHYSFPQIFIGKQFIGGYSDLIDKYNNLSLHDILLEEENINLSVDF
jgi:glutaredoxin 3